MKSAEQIRVVLVDEHALVRAGLRALLQTAGEVNVVGDVADACDAPALVRQTQAQVLIMDRPSGAEDSVTVARMLASAAVKTNLLVLTMMGAPGALEGMLAAGARGYLTRSAVASDLIDAVRTVADGGIYRCPLVETPRSADPVVDVERRRFEKLTDREREVLVCTARRVRIATGIQSAIPLKSVQHKSQGNIDMHPTKNDLPIEKRAALALLLNASLADLIDLGLQAKQSHWNVKGPTFIALHELFDSIAEVVGEFVDDVAERIVALGGIAEGTIGIVSKRTKLASYPVNITSGKDHVEALSTALATVGKSVRSDIDKATDLGDADSADLLTGISRSIDKNLWFVEAHLQGDK